MMNFQAECKNRNACRVAKVEIKWDFGGILIRSRIDKFGISPYPGPNPGQFMSLANLSSPRSDSATFSGTHLIFCIIPCMPGLLHLRELPNTPAFAFCEFHRNYPRRFWSPIVQRPKTTLSLIWIKLGGSRRWKSARREAFFRRNLLSLRSLNS